MDDPTDVDWANEINFKEASINDIIELCLKCETKDEAFKLRDSYRDYCVTPQVADENLGYLFGYCDEEDRKKLYSLFPVGHPVFGVKFGREEK